MLSSVSVTLMRCSIVPEGGTRIVCPVGRTREGSVIPFAHIRAAGVELIRSAIVCNVSPRRAGTMLTRCGIVVMIVPGRARYPAKVEATEEPLNDVVVLPPGTATVTSTFVLSLVSVAPGRVAPFGSVMLPAPAGSPVAGSISAGADQKPPPSSTTAVTVTRKIGGISRFM